MSPMSPMRRIALVLAGAACLLLAGTAGAAFAVSGGGYQPYQQGCHAGDDDYDTPAGGVYPGCHSVALNVESGTTTDGSPDNGNTKYAQVGEDQAPADPRSTGTPTPYSLGLPGSSGSPHAGCVAVNTDGTGGSPAPAGPPEPAGEAADSGYGCGSNPGGIGFESNFDYYQYYCPIAETLGMACEAAAPGTTTVSPETGPAVAYEPLVQDGVLVYFGMDDNTDNGEHDGLGPYSTSTQPANDGAVNGPSDGGAVMLLLTPRGAASPPSQTHPEGLANASEGSCADGICQEATTQQQTVYEGCGASDSDGSAPCDPGTPGQANVYDYAPGGDPANDPSVYSESPGCNSGSDQTAGATSCGAGGMNAYRSATPARENAEPGVQVFSDPDPQRSPAAPAPLWPTPGVYVGTCGVYAGSEATTGQLVGPLGATPVTNGAGQVAVDPAPGSC